MCIQDIFKIISSVQTSDQSEMKSILFWKQFFMLSKYNKNRLYYYDNLFIDINASKMIYEDNLNDVADILDDYNLLY